MSSDANEKLQNEITKTLDQIERNYLRKMRGQMFRCSAECCDDTLSSSERVQRCVQDCNQNIQEAEDFIGGELNNLRDRLSRCHMDCNDKIRDTIGVNPTQVDIDRYRKELDKCALDCAESHLSLISQIYKRTKEFLSKSNLQAV